MNKLFTTGVALLTLFTPIYGQDYIKESISNIVDKSLNIVSQHAINMAYSLISSPGKLPKSIKNNAIETCSYNWWCSGFYPGQLWYLYENNPSNELKYLAEEFTSRVEPAKNILNTHDLGFMIHCSFGNGYRLTNNSHYYEVMKTAANSLSTRYNPKVGLIRSWDFNKGKWQYPVIIDNMMNLEFMMDMSFYMDNDDFKDLSISHASKTLKYHYRTDFSCYHVVSYDTITGKPHIKQTHQGYSDASTWARGQAWGLYGFTMMYNKSKKKKYLRQAIRIADFLINHPNMPKDRIPFWDFDDPKIPNTYKDASAAAIMASALIDLSQHCGKKGEKYLYFAEEQLRSLCSNDYLASVGSNNNFALKHSVGNFPANSEIDVPLSYADYYYTEALLRMKKLMNRGEYPSNQ